VTGPSTTVRPPVTWVVLPTAVNVVGLGLLTWSVATQIGRLDTGGSRVAASALLAAAAACWILWVGLREFTSLQPPLASAPLAAMALVGGALVAFAPVALVFVAVAVLGAAMRGPIALAVGIGVAGCAAMFAGVAIAGHSLAIPVGGLAAVSAGLLVGTVRQQALERSEQRAEVELETARAEVQQARAQVLSERNHLARELHDVLAHTLAALSLQLEALSTVVDAEPQVSEAVRSQLERTRQLVREGLDEARGAVRALREDPSPLGDQLAKLSCEHDADFSVTGSPRPLPAQVVTTAYRVVQEALTNVMKHAAGAPTSVSLRFADGAVSVTVDNVAAASAPSLEETGAGYGLLGIAERLDLLGGSLEAGPSPGGWRVAATIPVAGAPGPAHDGAAA
jgi:signal transduction histidine kinase